MRTPYRKPGKFSQQKPDPLLTPWKFAELKSKLEHLKNISRPHAAAEVARLAELGDFSENAEYQLAKGKLRGINNAILKLESQLNQAEIIEPTVQSNTIAVGHTVTVENEQGRKSYTILGSTETNPQKGVISYTSPLGAALLGHGIGETVMVEIGNKQITYTIVKIQ